MGVRQGRAAQGQCDLQRRVPENPGGLRRARDLHLFRDGAATFWALKDPTRVMAVCELLGHEPRMTERHYNQATGISAGRKLADALARQSIPTGQGAAHTVT